MNGTQFLLTTAVFGAAFAMICLYFDKYRHEDPQFQHKLKQKRKVSKSMKKIEDDEDVIKFTEEEDKEARIFREIELAENYMCMEKYSKAVIHFANAISGCVEPSKLFISLKRTLPITVFDELIDRLNKKHKIQMEKFRNNTLIKTLLDREERMRRRNSFHSHPHLATADKFPGDTGFPPGITVDELFLFRRRKPPDLTIRDNLRPRGGTFQLIKSEYKRRFCKDIFQQNFEELKRFTKPEDTLKVEGVLLCNPEYRDTFIEHPIDAVNKRNLLSEQMDNRHHEESDSSEDEQLKKIRINRHLFRRPTVLKLEGDIYTTTENAENFVKYLLSERSELLRHPTSLKLEGEMEVKTENRDKYIPFDYQMRPPLLKTSTNLHLEGNIDVMTENREKYLPLKPFPRPALTKRITNLHLEGDLNMEPEYKHVFVEHKDVERTRSNVPLNSFKPDDFLHTEIDEMEKFVKREIQPAIPSLRESKEKKITLGTDSPVKKAEYKSKFVEHSKFERSIMKKPKENLKLEGNMNVVTENKMQFVEKPPSRSALKKTNNNLALEGKIDLNPEYKNAYVNFYKDAYGKFGIVPDKSSSRTRRVHLKSEGEMETSPEYKSAFVDFPRQRPSTRKPAEHIQIEGNVSSMTEKRSQFVEYPSATRARLLKRQTELKLEGPIECYPEYRRAFIDYVTRDHAAQRQPRLPDNLDLEKKKFFDPGTERTMLKTVEHAARPEDVVNKSVKLVVPDQQHRRHSSLSPVSTLSGSKSNKSAISNAENRLFGPKILLHPKRQTKSEIDRANINMRERQSRSRKRYGEAELVENLAYVSPIRYRLPRDISPRWTKEDKNCEKHSFVVLGNIEIESCTDCSSKRLGSKQLFKEQKWMPSWYSTSSKN
ncbi:hypothetical protein FQA39_LY11386 [Lamprigera yunnana]|nr:hypothetical protein FQA39_LY11386 [Lamprigera yunnana]